MKQIVELDEEGALHLPSDMLGRFEPHTRFAVEVEGEVLILRPERDQELGAGATPEARAEAFRQWAMRKRPPAPPLSDEALRRENIYD